MSRLHVINSLLIVIVLCASTANPVAAQNSCPPSPPWFDCSETSVGYTPLNQMVAPQTYVGQEFNAGTTFVGGLYGNYQNSPPGTHQAQALSKSGQIQPLNTSGAPDPNGVIGVMSLGMSNTNQEFAVFVDLVAADPAISDSVVAINGAQPTKTAASWANPGSSNPWDRIAFPPNVTNKQVQVLWIKLTDYPSDYPNLQDHLATIVYSRLPEYGFTNVKLIYFSSRIYAGYTLCGLNPEPYGYESAFPVQQLILDQITSQNYGANTPVLLWGPYLWADGTTLNAQTGIKWTCHENLSNPLMDFQDDGTHPSIYGETKVAQALLNFFKTDVTSVPWFTGEVTATATPNPSANPQPGDTDGDGDVDIFDYTTLLTQFGANCRNGCTADFEPDGDVDIFDYSTLLANFGS